ncbi:hypothetical protein E2562_034773 [Oryza meyeriana var. granulata]|uniref:Uncharacterized protein n=1 Tax=Oryza meyeriana var. granulata TaxID=110450 RepID=A0A6G1CKZ4_9ORYZ|nr:hypothetical protein E2562_034773 [Oryza meyeriana var. granulata]
MVPAKGKAMRTGRSGRRWAFDAEHEAAPQHRVGSPTGHHDTPYGHHWHCSKAAFVSGGSGRNLQVG